MKIFLKLVTQIFAVFLHLRNMLLLVLKRMLIVIYCLNIKPELLKKSLIYSQFHYPYIAVPNTLPPFLKL
jgi:hypothetical protein